MKMRRPSVAQAFRAEMFALDAEMKDDPSPSKFWVKNIKKSFRYLSVSTYIIFRWLLQDFKVTVTFDDMMMCMTIFVLFADSILILTGPKKYDYGINLFNEICFFTFIFELVANTCLNTTFENVYFKSINDFKCEYTGYLFTYFWWLDILSIVSMFPDITLIADGLHLGSVSNTASSGGTNYSKAGRVVRLIRLVRLVRLYKIAMEKKKRDNLEKDLLEQVGAGDMDHDELKIKMALFNKRESRLGSTLSNIMTQRIILLVLFMVIILPLLLYSEIDFGSIYLTRALHTVVSSNANASDAILDSMIKLYMSIVKNNNNNIAPPSTATDVYLLSLTVNSVNYINHAAAIDAARPSSIISNSYTSTVGSSTYTTNAIFNSNPIIRLLALYSIIMTIFVAACLIIASVVFTSDTERLVLNPIDRMMNLVEAVARSPLSKVELMDSEQETQMEIKQLEETIEKITGLLRVGFGEAGANIISANLQVSGATSSAINPLIPGIRVYSLVGFCDIHHFDDVLLLLQADVFTFVNRIAEVVHHNAHTWSGQCNKNLGNAFVIIWRIGDEKTVAEEVAGRLGAASKSSKKSSQVIDLKRIPGAGTLAEHALIAYLKIIADINRNEDILFYRKEPKLTDNGKSEFKVRMGFGLHAGWAIEGAVGSIYKVDATYLSPHVNMAARLETSSRQYGVPLLASHFFWELMDDSIKARCRLLDVVTVKGSEVPIGIYTYDCMQDQVFPYQAKAPQRKSKNKIMASAKAKGSGSNLTLLSADSYDDDDASNIDSSPRAKLNESSAAMFFSPSDDTSDAFESDADLLALRKHITPEFISVFKDGIDAYIAGEWSNARKHLQSSNELMKQLVPGCEGDGPCLTLLEYMSERNWTAPEDWAGYRPLTSK